MPTPARRILAGSERHIPSTASIAGDADKSEIITATIYVRQNPVGLQLPLNEDVRALTSRALRHLGPADREAAFGADPEDLKRIEEFAAAGGLTVVETSTIKRSVKVSGTVEALGAAFGAELKIYDSPMGRYRGRVGPVTVPAELADIVDAVFGLDNRRMGRSYLCKRARPVPSRAITPPNVYVPPQVAQLYNFPPGFDGSGQCIAIFTFNGQLASTGITATGGYNIDAIRKYFTELLHMKAPHITDVVVHGPGNTPGDGTSQTDVSGEVMLDIQVVASCAPGARIVMYFTEFTEQGWVDAIMTAVADHDNRPSVFSLSYGNPEDGGGQSLWTRAAIRMINHAFKRAALEGATICCAAGDDGSSDQINDSLAHVDFPASSPFVLGCGGTRLESSNGNVTNESVWNDGPGSATGGGISALFALPTYQRAAQVPPSTNPGHRIGRGVPDVSGLADPDTGLVIMNNDGELERFPVGGTSATAPLWAALIARINQALGTPVGFINPALYQMIGSGIFRDIVSGDNGLYRASPNWDPCTGLGSPDGVGLLTALHSVPPAPHQVSPTTPADQMLTALACLQSQLAAEGAQRGALQAQLARLEATLAQFASVLTAQVR